MKLCFSTLGCTERDLDEIIAISKKFNIKNVELRGISGILDCRKISDFLDGNIDNTKQLFKNTNTNPLIIGTSCSFHKAENYENSIDEGLFAINVATKLGSLGIRIFGNKLVQGSTERIIDGIKTLCEYDKTKNVQILLEVHGDYNTYENLLPILEAFKNVSNFGLIWDIQHTSKTYGANWAEFYNLTKSFIRHVHIKDSNENVLTQIGEGLLPIKEIIEYMKNDGYSGAFSLEWEKKWHNELPSIESALEKLIAIANDL